MGNWTPGYRPQSANNPIGYRYVKMIVAPDALNRLLARLCDSSSNMNLLFSIPPSSPHSNHRPRLSLRAVELTMAPAASGLKALQALG